MYLKKSIFLFIAMMALPSCAFVDNQVQLEYQDVQGVTQTSGDEGVIYLARFDDARTDKSRVGVVKNGYGMETAKVLSADDPTVWVSNTIKGNLQKRGYTVETVEKDFTPQNGQFFLSGKLTNVMSEPKMGFWTATITGNIDAIAQAEYGGRQKDKAINGHSEKTSMVTTGGDLHKGVLNDALADFVRNLIGWLDELKS